MYSFIIYLFIMHSSIIIKYPSLPASSSTYSLIHSSLVYEFSTCPPIINLSLSIHHPSNHPSTYTCLIYLPIYPLIHSSSCIYQSIHRPSTHSPFHSSFIHPYHSSTHPIVNLFIIFIYHIFLPKTIQESIPYLSIHPPMHSSFIHSSAICHPFI